MLLQVKKSAFRLLKLDFLNLKVRKQPYRHLLHPGFVRILSTK